MPIHKRGIEADLEVVFAASVHEFLHEVTTAIVVGVVGVYLGIPKGKSLVMACGEDGVFRAHLFCHFAPLARTAYLGGKGFRKRFVFGNGVVLVCLRPFARTELGIETVMDKHTKARIAEPCHAAVAGLRGLFFILSSADVIHDIRSFLRERRVCLRLLFHAFASVSQSVSASHIPLSVI